MAPDALPAPMMTVRPLGLGGRCAGMQREGSAASTAAWNMDLSRSVGVIKGLRWPLPSHRRLQQGKRTDYRQQKKPGVSGFSVEQTEELAPDCGLGRVLMNRQPSADGCAAQRPLFGVKRIWPGLVS